MENLEFPSYSDDDYLTRQDFKQIEFPKSIDVAYAVCGKQCGNNKFIVDGQTQVCPICGQNLFRAIVTQYDLDSNMYEEV